MQGTLKQHRIPAVLRLIGSHVSPGTVCLSQSVTLHLPWAYFLLVMLLCVFSGTLPSICSPCSLPTPRSVNSVSAVSHGCLPVSCCSRQLRVLTMPTSSFLSRLFSPQIVRQPAQIVMVVAAPSPKPHQRVFLPNQITLKLAYLPLPLSCCVTRLAGIFTQAPCTLEFFANETKVM